MNYRIARLFVCSFALLLISSSSGYSQERLPSTGKVTIVAAVKRRTVAKISGTLVAERGKAFVLMITDPANAEVFIDGAPAGQSNEEGTFRAELKTGKQYQVDVKKDRYMPFSQQVNLTAADPLLLQANLRATFGTIKILNVPNDANLLLDGQKTASTVDETEKQTIISDIPVGAHKVTITNPKFVTWEKEVDVIGGYDTSLAPELIPAAKLSIRTLAATDVLIDNVKQGVTSDKGDLAIPTPLQPGTHQVKLVKAGYVDEVKTVNLEATDRNSLYVEELEPTPTYSAFEDFFNDGLIFWNGTGNWKYDSQKKRATIQEPAKPGPMPDLGLAKGKSFRDYDWVCDVWFDNGIGASWVLRAHNAQTYYLFEVSVKDQKLRTYLVDHGKRTPFPPSEVLVSLRDRTTDYRIRAEVQGNRIRTYIKNNLTGEEEQCGVLVDNTLRYGTVGFTATGGEVFTVKDAFVRPFADVNGPAGK